MAQQRVLQLPKFAVVEVMLDLNGRDSLNSERWEIRDAFWRQVLERLNELYPENQSEVRTVNHVKRTWCALKQRVLARAKTANREMLASDRKVLYLLQVLNSLDDDAQISVEQLEKKMNPDNNDNNMSTNPSFQHVSGEDLCLPKNVDPLLDSMIVCEGRSALPKKRSTTVAGKAEYRHFWDKVHMLLQFNPQCAGRSVLSFQRAWYNIRMYYNEKLKKGSRDNSLRERKALFLMRVLNQQQARLELGNGMVKDMDEHDENGFENGLDSLLNGNLCEVVKGEPLDLNQLINSKFAQEEEIVDNDASSSVYESINPNEHLDIMSVLKPSALIQPNSGSMNVDDQPDDESTFSDESELRHKLLMCQIERERAQTELLKAQKRLIEAQLQGMFRSEVPLFQNGISDLDKL